MQLPPHDDSLADYRQLLDRIDQLCGKITSAYTAQIFCKAGCSSCCRHLTLFPVEAASVAAAIVRLPAEVRRVLVERADNWEGEGCPLLIDDLCTVYAVRPVICRTHGLPVLFNQADGGKGIDCCPLNFKGVEVVPGSAAISLETVNTLLTAINALFVEKSGNSRFKTAERFAIAEIIRLSEEK